MAKKLILTPSVLLNFIGGFVESGIDEVPEEAGLYVVFVCKESAIGYSCKQIAYVGKADKSETSNLRERMREHIRDDFKNWKGICGMTDDEIFVFCYAVYDDALLSDVESALIYRNQPIINIQNKDRYNGKSWYLNIVSQGEIGLLRPNIYVMRLVPGSR